MHGMSSYSKWAVPVRSILRRERIRKIEAQRLLPHDCSRVVAVRRMASIPGRTFSRIKDRHRYITGSAPRTGARCLGSTQSVCDRILFSNVPVKPSPVLDQVGVLNRPRLNSQITPDGSGSTTSLGGSARRRSCDCRNCNHIPNSGLGGELLALCRCPPNDGQKEVSRRGAVANPWTRRY